MKVIDNFHKRRNHFAVLTHLLNTSSEVVIASPFLMEDFASILTNSVVRRLDHITLVTTMNPGSPEQIRKANALHALVLTIPDEKKLSIMIDNKLHGKVYLFRKGPTFFTGIVTSANLTNKGLRENHEWGLQINDQKHLDRLARAVTTNPEVFYLTKDDVLKAAKRAKEFLAEHPNVGKEKVKLDLTDGLSADRRYASTKYWIKPMGWTNHHIPNSESFDVPTLKLSFSKRRPSGVGRNDVMFLYRVGHGQILTMCSVDSELMRETAKDISRDAHARRWPWYVMSRNLTPDFGREWLKRNLRAGDLVKEFKKVHPSKHVTFVGGDTLGTLNRGQDKVHISDDFANFIMSKVSKGRGQ